jgi:hypothetical protein
MAIAPNSGPWRALPHSVRREVLVQSRRWHPHPDPDVQQAAIGWARRVRTPRRWSLPVAVTAVAAFVVGQDLAAHHLDAELNLKVLTWSVGAVVGAVPAMWLYSRFQSQRCAALVEAANLRALLARRPPDTPAPRRVQGTGWPVTTALLIAIAPVAVFVVVSADQLLRPDALRASVIHGALTATPLVCVMVVAGLGWKRPSRGFLTPTRNREAIWLDDEGIVLAQHGLALGWHEIQAVDVQPLPGEGPAFPVCVAIILPPEVADAVIGRPKSKGNRRRLSRAFNGGYILNIPADRLRQSPEAIVSAARAYLTEYDVRTADQYP